MGSIFEGEGVAKIPYQDKILKSISLKEKDLVEMSLKSRTQLVQKLAR